MSNEIVLTRYLYILDEAIYTLQNALIDGKSFDECAFWCGEIFYSGFQDKLWQFIFEFNYNFCAVTNPKYNKKLIKLFNQDDTSIENILSAITILFYCKKKTSVVFKSWQLSPSTPNKIYIGRSPKWIKNVSDNKNYVNFVRSIHNKNFINIVYYLKYYQDIDNDNKKTNKDAKIEIIYNIVKKYFKIVHNKTLPDKLNPFYNKNGHTILYIIHHMFYEGKDIQQRSIFTKCAHETYMPQLIKDNDRIEPAYKTLPVKLRYSISTDIGCFPLERYRINSKTINDIYWYHWEYYSYKSPLWKSRFDKCCITIDHKKQEIVFDNDEIYEEFGEKYYYETDEQTKEVQERSICSIPKISTDEWIKKKLIIQ